MIAHQLVDGLVEELLRNQLGGCLLGTHLGEYIVETVPEQQFIGDRTLFPIQYGP